MKELPVTPYPEATSPTFLEMMAKLPATPSEVEQQPTSEKLKPQLPRETPTEPQQSPVRVDKAKISLAEKPQESSSRVEEAPKICLAEPPAPAAAVSSPRNDGVTPVELDQKSTELKPQLPQISSTEPQKPSSNADEESKVSLAEPSSASSSPRNEDVTPSEMATHARMERLFAESIFGVIHRRQPFLARKIMSILLSSHGTLSSILESEQTLNNEIERILGALPICRHSFEHLARKLKAGDKIISHWRTEDLVKSKGKDKATVKKVNDNKTVNIAFDDGCNQFEIPCGWVLVESMTSLRRERVGEWYPVDVQRIYKDGTWRTAGEVMLVRPSEGNLGILRMVHPNSLYAQTGMKLKTCPCADAALHDTRNDTYVCDVCKKKDIPIGTAMIGCRECNWDMCLDCTKQCGFILVDKSNKAESPRPTIPSPRTQPESPKDAPKKPPTPVARRNTVPKPIPTKCTACNTQFPSKASFKRHKSSCRGVPAMHQTQNEIRRPNTGFERMQRGFSEDDALAEALKRSKTLSPPVKKDPPLLCATCKKVYPKKQFGRDEWARLNRRCKICVQKAVKLRDMHTEQSNIYQDPMAEAIRLSQEAYVQINTPVAVDDAATEECPICLADKPIVELTTPYGCRHGICRDCVRETFTKFRNCPECRKFKFNAASKPFVPER